MAVDSTPGGGVPRSRVLALVIGALVVAGIVVALAALASREPEGGADAVAAKPTTSEALTGRPAIALPPVAGIPEDPQQRVVWATQRRVTDPGTAADLRLAAAQAAAGDAAAARATLRGNEAPAAQAAMALLDYDAADPAPTIARLKALAAAAPANQFIGFSYGAALLWSGQRAAGEEVLRGVRDASPDTFYGVAADDLSHPVLPPGYPPFITSEPPPTASLAELKAAAAAQPGALQPQLYYAAALVADGQRRAAMDAFDAALAVDPGSLDARVGRIIAAYSKDNPAAAFGQMGPLVRDNPSDPSPRLHLALMLLWLRDPETARAEFRQVATLAPDTRLGRTAQQFLDSL